MEGLLIALITTVGAIISAWVGARAKKWVDARNADREQWKTLVDQWRSDVKELRAMRAEDKRVYEAELRELRARIDQLESDRLADREQIRQLTDDLAVLSAWARAVVVLLDAHEIEFPELPIDLED